MEKVFDMKSPTYHKALLKFHEWGWDDGRFERPKQKLMRPDTREAYERGYTAGRKFQIDLEAQYSKK